MKASFSFKVLLGLPLILMVDYVFMALVGCGSNCLGAKNTFYCGPFCIIGKVVLLLSAVLFLFMFLPEFKQFLDHKKNAPSNPKP